MYPHITEWLPGYWIWQGSSGCTRQGDWTACAWLRLWCHCLVAVHFGAVWLRCLAWEKKLQSSSRVCQDPQAEWRKWLDGHGCRSSCMVQGYEGVLVQTIYRPVWLSAFVGEVSVKEWFKGGWMYRVTPGIPLICKQRMSNFCGQEMDSRGCSVSISKGGFLPIPLASYSETLPNATGQILFSATPMQPYWSQQLSVLQPWPDAITWGLGILGAQAVLAFPARWQRIALAMKLLLPE